MSYLMNIEGYGYTDALEYLAKKFCVLLDPHPDKPAGKPVQKMKKEARLPKGWIRVLIAPECWPPRD